MLDAVQPSAAVRPVAVHPVGPEPAPVVVAEPGAPITEELAEIHVGRTCFKTGPPTTVGVELEWLVFDLDAPEAPVPAERALAALRDWVADPGAPPALVPAPRPPGSGSDRPPPAGAAHTAGPAAVGPLTAGLVNTDFGRPGSPVPAPFSPVPGPLAGLLTFEPGGQLELSSPPAPLLDCLRWTAADMAALRGRLRAARLALVGLGLDPIRSPRRLTDAPRYRAMERHFDRRGPQGRTMMCSTASVQVCLDAGADEAEIGARWAALHALGPALVALFAHSPLQAGRPTGWRCTRQAVWSAIDPSRTRPPAAATDPRTGYARYALDAEVLAVRRADGSWHAPAGLTFRGWLADKSGELPRPTLDDLDYHLSTLFPPVRPRGHLEVRVLDAQAGDRWQLAAALVATVLDDPVARDAALAAAAPAEGCWTLAARHGLSAPRIGRAAAAVAAAAVAAMARAGLPPELITQAGEFAETAARGRSPADDVLDRWARGEPAPYLGGRRGYGRPTADRPAVRPGSTRSVPPPSGSGWSRSPRSGPGRAGRHASGPHIERDGSH